MDEFSSSAPSGASSGPAGPVGSAEREPQGDLAFWGEPSWLDGIRSRRGRGPWAGGLTGRLRDGRVGAVALVVLALLAGVVFYKVGAGGSDASASPAPATSVRRTRTPTRDAAPAAPAAPASTGVPASPSAPAPAKPDPSRGVVVHVAGAVVTPGVVQLATGARVIDAIEAAGGGLPNADLDRLNLAAKVVDGERVLVQHVGDPPAAADPPVSADVGTGATGGPLNLNTATQAQLEQLPGIGPSLAQAIIAERTRKGGFRSVNELRDVRGIGERRFADLRNLVTV